MKLTISTVEKTLTVEDEELSGLFAEWQTAPERSSREHAAWERVEERAAVLAEVEESETDYVVDVMPVRDEEQALVSPDLGLSNERVKELEQPVTDEQFAWLERNGRLDNGKTFEENMREAEALLSHTTDSDCMVGVDGLCVGCGVLHGEPCADCGGRGYHQNECVAISPEAETHPQTDEHLAGCASCMMAHDKALPDSPSVAADLVEAAAPALLEALEFVLLTIEHRDGLKYRMDLFTADERAKIRAAIALTGRPLSPSGREVR